MAGIDLLGHVVGLGLDLILDAVGAGSIFVASLAVGDPLVGGGKAGAAGGAAGRHALAVFVVFGVDGEAAQVVLAGLVGRISGGEGGGVVGFRALEQAYAACALKGGLRLQSGAVLVQEESAVPIQAAGVGVALGGGGVGDAVL